VLCGACTARGGVRRRGRACQFLGSWTAKSRLEIVRSQVSMDIAHDMVSCEERVKICNKEERLRIRERDSNHEGIKSVYCE
jgi:hypothetical protein